LVDAVRLQGTVGQLRLAAGQRPRQLRGNPFGVFLAGGAGNRKQRPPSCVQ
jgi:hypothetical protein